MTQTSESKNIEPSAPAVAAEGQALMRYTGAYVAPTGLYLGKYAGWKDQPAIAVDGEDVERMLSFGVWEVVKAEAGGDASELAADVTQQTQADIQTAEDKLRATLDEAAQAEAAQDSAQAEAVQDVSDDEDTVRRRGGRKARADKE